MTLISPNGNYFPLNQNALVITDMRVKFSIQRSVKADPNSCTLEIYNLGDSSRKFCETKPLTVWIDAGYDNQPKQLFTGDLHFGFSRLEKPEWITKMQLRDGGTAYDQARHNVTYAEGVTVGKIVDDLASQMQLTVDPAQRRALASQLSRRIPCAQVIQGRVKDQLTQVLSPLGIQWSTQNSKLELLRDVDTTGLTYVISQETGMIGSPEWTSPKNDTKPNQVKVKCLLQPEIVAGSPIKIQSLATNGTFRVQKVVHRGDTHGKEWITEIEAVPPGALGGSDPISWKTNGSSSGSPTGGA